MNPKISVILTTYNRKKRLKKAIESVLDQSFKDWELIIVDDCSTDKTHKVIKKYERKDKRIRSILRKENFGQHPKPKNDGTMAAKAPLIAYLDDDNVYKKDHLFALYKELLKNKDVDGVYGDRMIINEDTGKEFPGIASDFIPALLGERNYIDTADVLIKKKTIEHVGGWDESLVKFADWNLWVRMANAGFKLKRVPLILTDYHVHEGCNQLKSKDMPFDPRVVRIWPVKTSYGKEKPCKIALFTLTKDRWDYTKQMLESLKKNAGYKYDHYIVDNGSTDGTVKKLGEYKIKKLIKNKTNVGISKGSNQAVDEIMKGDYDLVIKLDNDCKLITKDTLKRVADCWAYSRQIVVSPYIEGLRDNLGGGKRVRLPGQQSEYLQVGSESIQLAEHIGGIFCIAPAHLYKTFRWKEDDNLHGTQDLDFSIFCLSNKIAPSYFAGIRAEHIDGTEGQEKKYPKYFELRKEEKTTKYKQRR